MKFIIDAQLPQALVSILEGHDVIHTSTLQAGNTTSDFSINELSVLEKRALITKDSDFYYSFMATQKPYKLVLEKLGNMKLKDLKDYFQSNAEKIAELLMDHSFLILELERIRVLK